MKWERHILTRAINTDLITKPMSAKASTLQKKKTWTADFSACQWQSMKVIVWASALVCGYMEHLRRLWCFHEAPLKTQAVHCHLHSSAPDSKMRRETATEKKTSSGHCKHTRTNTYKHRDQTNVQIRINSKIVLWMTTLNPWGKCVSIFSGVEIIPTTRALEIIQEFIIAFWFL